LRAHSCKNSGGYGPEADDWGFICFVSIAIGRPRTVAADMHSLDSQLVGTYSIDHKERSQFNEEDGPEVAGVAAAAGLQPKWPTAGGCFWLGTGFASPFLRRTTAPCGRCRTEPTANALGRPQSVKSPTHNPTNQLRAQGVFGACFGGGQNATTGCSLAQIRSAAKKQARGTGAAICCVGAGPTTHWHTGTAIKVPPPC
jgi:hypothetical protein